jgi:hypothetical protein
MYMFRFILIAVVVLFAPAAMAQTIPPVDLSGYAWSSNIGWISLNCLNDSNCATSDYKVTVNADRTVTGYAWSSNIGWIKFGGLTGFPAGGGTAGSNVTLTGSYPNLTFNGWARACAATAGGTCASMSTSSAAGGWDGWISMRGTNYAVSANMGVGMNSDSYAWGSDVVGWIDMFSYVTFATQSASLSGTSCTIPVGQNTCGGSLTWDIDTALASPNIYNVRTSASVSTNASANNYGVTLTFGNTTFQARSNTSVLASRVLSATCAAGLVHNGSQCVVGTSTEPSILNFTAQPRFVRMGGNATVTWGLSTITGSTCAITGPNTNYAVGTTSGTLTVGPIRSQSTYKITCTGSYGSVSQQAIVEVIPVAEEV